MSSLEKLIISGIRSFTPDRREAIQFDHPITLIVGPNGSGKTTIIECLKVSVTGDLPPNVKSGQNFVHDPKLRDSPDTKGQVRLIFRDSIKNKKIQIVRSFQLSYIKNKKLGINQSDPIKTQFRVLESVLQTKDDETGEIASISHKCVDINNQVPKLFGISPAIIENVIFCHQEDSNWPLQDTAKIKKKFDDLFGATRFSKSLDTFTKLKNEYKKKKKEMALENELLKQKVTLLEDTERKREEFSKRISDITEQYDILFRELTGLSEVGYKNSEKIKRIEFLYNDLKIKKSISDTYYNDIKNIRHSDNNFNDICEDMLSTPLDKLECQKISKTQEHDKLSIELKDIKKETEELEYNIKNIKTDKEDKNSYTKTYNQVLVLISGMCDSPIISEHEELLYFLRDLQYQIENICNGDGIFDWDSALTWVEGLQMDDLEAINIEIAICNEKLKTNNEHKQHIISCLEDLRVMERDYERNLDQLNHYIKDYSNINDEIDKIESEMSEYKENILDNFRSLTNKQEVKLSDEVPEIFSDIFNSTFELGTLDGEIGILANLALLKAENEDIEAILLSKLGSFDTIDKVINYKQNIYNEKKRSTISFWKELDYKWESKTRNSLFTSRKAQLEAEYNILKNKLETFPSDMIEKRDLINSKLEYLKNTKIMDIKTELSQEEINEKSLNELAQSLNLRKNSVEIERKNLISVLKNQLLDIQEKCKYLYSNRDKLSSTCEVLNEEEIMKKVEYLGNTEKMRYQKMIDCKKEIETLNKCIQLKHKQESVSIMETSMAEIINEIYKELNNEGPFDLTLLPQESDSQLYIADYMKKIEVLLEKERENLSNLQRNLEKYKCNLSKLDGEKKVNMDWLEKCKEDMIRYSPLEKLSYEYKQNIFKLNVISIIVDDLEKYQWALQKALMKFHATKMKEINRTIKELWKVTYKGRDIDYIAIRSDVDNDQEDDAKLSVSSKSVSSTKSFNYRVVMVQKGVELDMKGRCSAGQRVLACILIRLALAESFCVNCGILALDEPTTNLDRDNIEGLANALSYLIKYRKSQQNFQLILITHDEEFVRIMAHAQHCNHFYKIVKDDDGYSTIRQVDIRGF
ncbi:uncharacterized protein CMU_029180 [Cryptosporidium muris RN66]|uniref:DNA repair protein RAD50 n=1 Tax=Cryptosporidium muris (strain RN66) TaxID=441375 RepID=B6AI03_CRYMR|nr:uncharacterized protein CMU_029180 [Cryptosporidium muris RN66]EEA07844.1 hypothetical protein, conserved [Cryptosporidium muris RN66]|eukprot:XP_002142193.1 hypothetical protein [Cryptosporidium muris RN66]